MEMNFNLNEAKESSGKSFIKQPQSSEIQKGSGKGGVINASKTTDQNKIIPIK